MYLQGCFYKNSYDCRIVYEAGLLIPWKVIAAFLAARTSSMRSSFALLVRGTNITHASLQAAKKFCSHGLLQVRVRSLLNQYIIVSGFEAGRGA